MSLLEIKNFHFAYEDNEILKGVDLALEDEEIICLVGANGCGKTTLLDCIIGVHSTTKGDLWIQGQNQSKMQQKEKAKVISYVPQSHRESFPYTVREMVVMGRAPYIEYYTGPQAKDYEIASKAIETLGIKRFTNRLYTQLSGGEAQLVMIARAITQEAPIIVMDEPTAALDFKNEQLILNTVMTLVKEKKVSVVMATHFPNHAFYFENRGIKTRVVMMKEGKVLYSGRPSEILTESTMEDVYGIESKIVSFEHKGQKGKVIATW